MPARRQWQRESKSPQGYQPPSPQTCAVQAAALPPQLMTSTPDRGALHVYACRFLPYVFPWRASTLAMYSRTRRSVLRRNSRPSAKSKTKLRSRIANPPNRDRDMPCRARNASISVNKSPMPVTVGYFRHARNDYRLRCRVFPTMVVTTHTKEGDQT